MLTAFTATRVGKRLEFQTEVATDEVRLDTKIGASMHDLDNASNCMVVNIPFVRISASCFNVLIYRIRIPGSVAIRSKRTSKSIICVRGL